MGTCSWKYPSWAGIVYSRPDNINYLAEYAAKYPTVEIDQWFWSLFGPGKVALPDIGTVAEYASAVGRDFAFTIKAPNSITLTHFYRKKGETGLRPNADFLSVDLASRFFERISPLREQTAAVMFQFEYLNRQKLSGLDEFIERFETFRASLPPGWPLAVEIRNPNYLGAKFFDFLRRNDLAMVFCEGYYMPSIVEVYRKNRDRFAERAIVRLMGPDRSGIEEETGNRWDSVVWPRDGELEGVAEVIQDMVSRGLNVIVNVNNHFEGSAPLTIGRLTRILRERFSQIL